MLRRPSQKRQSPAPFTLGAGLVSLTKTCRGYVVVVVQPVGEARLDPENTGAESGEALGGGLELFGGGKGVPFALGEVAFFVAGLEDSAVLHDYADPAGKA